MLEHDALINKSSLIMRIWKLAWRVNDMLMFWAIGFTVQTKILQDKNIVKVYSQNIGNCVLFRP